MHNDRRLIQKNKERKVQKYAMFKQHKRALKDTQPQPGFDYAGGSSGYGGGGYGDYGSGGAPVDQAATGGNEDWAAQPQQSWKKKKKKKVSAAEAARREWEEGQKVVQAERDAAQAAREQVAREKAAAHKRRSEQSAKLSKRNKRGQPVLGNQVERLLGLIQRQG